MVIAHFQIHKKIREIHPSSNIFFHFTYKIEKKTPRLKRGCFILHTQSCEMNATNTTGCNRTNEIRRTALVGRWCHAVHRIMRGIKQSTKG